MKEYKDKEILASKYAELGSLQKVAEYFNVSKKLILNYMKKHNIPRNKRVKKEKVKKVDTFHKGYIITNNGYRMVMRKEHPNADSKGYVREHIIVMEDKLGRYLNDDEVVHHIDKNKLNNNIENLALMSDYDHRKLHSSEPRKNVDLELAKNLLVSGYTMPQVAKYFSVSESGLRKKFNKNGIKLDLKRGGARRKTLKDL